MNVSALCKTTGKVEKMNVTNNNGRLSKDDIERLVREAEKYKNEDEIIKKKIKANNTLENYILYIKDILK